MNARILSALDKASHRLLDGYINAQHPGWGYLQLWQWHLCNASERALYPEDFR